MLKRNFNKYLINSLKNFKKTPSKLKKDKEYTYIDETPTLNEFKLLYLKNRKKTTTSF